MVFNSDGIAADVRDRRYDAVALFGDLHDRRTDPRFAALDQRFAAIDQRFDILDGEMSRQFRWIVGIQIAMFLALAGTMVLGFFALRS